MKSEQLFTLFTTGVKWSKYPFHPVFTTYTCAARYSAPGDSLRVRRVALDDIPGTAGKN